MTESRVGEYLVGANGTIRINEAGEAVRAAYLAARAATHRLDTTYVGAVIGWLLRKHEWLNEFTLSLSVSYEYNDAGGTYRTVNGSTDQFDLVSGATLPVEVVDESGSFDEGAAADYLEEFIWDMAGDLYSGLAEEIDEQPVVLRVRRESVADLLGCEPISGERAFRALFPELSGRLDD